MRRVIDKQTVAHFWAHQTQPEGYTSTRNFRFDRRELVSYSTAIGYHFGEFVLLSRNRFSVTTNIQIALASRAASHLKQISSGIFRRSDRLYNEPSADRVISEQEEYMTGLYADLVKPRIRMTTRATIASRIQHTAQDINYLIGYFKVKRALVTLPADLNTLISYTAVLLKKQAEEKAIAARKAELSARRKNAVRLNRWLAGTFQESIDTFLPYAVQKAAGDNSDLLTICGGDVLTGQNVTVPIAHTVRAIRFYRSRMIQGGLFTPWHKNGHRVSLGVFELDSINAQGTIQAGCHTITAREIERFINRWSSVLFSTPESEG